jgi:CheY-like chemotaxis protein
MKREDSGGLFVADDVTEAQARMDAWAVSPTGPMFGEKMQKPEHEAAAPELRAARILMVDDEPALGQLVQRLLRPDHEVVVQVAARAALQLLSVDPAFDVILCDLMMPDMTGMDFHKELSRSAPELARRLVFMTGGAFTPAAQKFLESVPNCRLDKPFSAETLRKTIAKTTRPPS